MMAAGDGRRLRRSSSWGRSCPWIGLIVRRLHDIGLTGWLYLLFFIPTVGGLIILVFALIPTQAQENQWGPVPAGVRV